MKELKVAMIGFGGIGASHKAAYDALSKEGTSVRLVAVCDKNKDSINKTQTTNLGTVDTGSFEGINFYYDCDELIKNEDFDIADICLPTFLHKEYTVKLLQAGKHVLCEKPMALSGVDCDEMITASVKSGKELMIGQCLRFDPAYLYLKGLVESLEFGKARRITMGRLSFMPAWGGWFTDSAKSGGVVTDFHIHDIDMLRFLFGEPYAVSSVSYPQDKGWQYVNSRFYYEELIAEAEASFDESPTAPFSMWYRVRFDRATVVLENESVTVFPDEGEPYAPELEKNDRIAKEIGYFAEIISRGEMNTVNPASSASESIKLSELVRESTEKNGEIIRRKT